MIQQVGNALITALVMKFMLNDVPHAVLDNPSNPYTPTGSTTFKIISRTGMKEHEYRWFPPPEEEKPARVYPYKRKRDVSHYSVVMTRTDGTCTIKLYEYLEGWRQKLRATWTGMEKAECEAKFEQVCSVIRDVILEEKQAMMR